MNQKKIDLKKEFKDLYAAGAEASIVTVPEIQYLAYDGEGDPNTSDEYRKCMDVLFGIAYGIKFQCKSELRDFSVMPLEGLWWSDNMSDFRSGRKDNWKWTMMIAQPGFVTEKQLESAAEKIREKKKLKEADKAYLMKMEEGKCAHILHKGPYAEEAANIQVLHDFIHNSGLSLRGRHREIYLNSPMRTAPEKLKTIIRQPVK